MNYVRTCEHSCGLTLYHSLQNIGYIIQNSHLDAALDAEWYSLKGKKCLALKHYEMSVVLASKRGFVHDAALINECFGEFLLYDYKDDDNSSSKKKDACFRINKAIHLYREWGSFKKANMLSNKYKTMLRDLI